MKEIDVNSFCAVSGTATGKDAERLYDHIKYLTSAGTTVVLDFSAIECVDLCFFKTILPHYYPDNDHLKFSNLSRFQKALLRETYLCLIQGVL